MTPLTHVQLHSLEQEDAITLVQFLRNQKPAYAYMQMTKDGVQALERAIARGKTISLSNYGEVLLTGDNEPDDDARTYMEEEYGFVHKK